MLTNIGEYIVGAYLKLKLGCDFVDYNVRPPGGGLEGLHELDVIGLDFKNSIAYLCEVTTHIRGTLYRDNRTTVERVKKKHERQKEYGHRFKSGNSNFTLFGQSAGPSEHKQSFYSSGRHFSALLRSN